MKPTVYIETTIPSYYHDIRPELSREIERTRTWWDDERAGYECFISPVVLDELCAGSYPTQAACLALVEGLPLLEVTPEVADIAAAYQAQRVMPRSPVRDALHAALASYYRLDYRLTWNCRHLANVNKHRMLEAVNVRLGLGVPLMVTPDLLQPWELET